jgi:RHS repeat-associated protein
VNRYPVPRLSVPRLSDVTDTAPDGNWHHTFLDLSPYAGQTATALVVGPGFPFTPVGPYDAWLANLTIQSPDGTVHPLFTGGAATGSIWGTCANSDLTLAVESTPVDAVVGTNFYLGDHLGTAQLELSQGGWPIWQGQFAPFGQEIVNGSTIPPAQPDGSSNHFKFTGKERDTESGLDYFGARYYASSMGRWMSPDWSAKEEPVPYAKLDNPQSLNLYGYVLNNPLGMADPDGHCCWDSAVKWVNDHPRTMQAVKGVGEVAIGVVAVGVAATAEVGTGGVATVGVIFAVQGGVASAVKGVTDIVGAATKTDVSGATKALDAVSNPAGQLVTAATGSLEKGATAAAIGAAVVTGANIKDLAEGSTGLRATKTGLAANDGKEAVTAVREAREHKEEHKPEEKQE